MPDGMTKQTDPVATVVDLDTKHEVEMSKNTFEYSDRSGLICKEGCRFSMGWCMREPYCPLSSAVCNVTIPTLPLFEMAESACLPFCYVLHYLLFIKFISAFYHVCVTGQLL